METFYYFDIYTFFRILGVIWLVSLIFTSAISVVLMFSGNKIFEKSGRNASYSYVPLYNLFVLLDIVEMSKFDFIFLICPGINFFFIFMMMYKLSIVMHTSSVFAFGLIFLPFIFLPILNYGKDLNEYEINEGNNVDDVSDSMMPLLTEAEYVDLSSVPDETPKVDNVFKAPTFNEEPVPVFKANKIKYREMVMPEETPEEITRVEPVKVEDIYTNRFINTKVTEEDDSIEIVEL